MTEPPPDAPFRVDLAAAFVATALGVVSFGVFHWIWIAKVPLVFLEGQIHAGLGALALAWALRSTRRRRPFHDSLEVGLLLGILSSSLKCNTQGVHSFFS